MAKKRLLIFAHYYAPDKASTGQLLKDLAEGMNEEYDVTVICVVPSYDGVVAEKYKKKKYYFEEYNGVTVIRIRVPEFSKDRKISRIKNIIVYFFGAITAAVKAGKQDYVFTISQPPILGGLLGVIGKWIKRAKMIYCIQDFNPEQIKAVEYITNKWLVSSLMAIDKFCCRHSDIIITVGRDLVETLNERFKHCNVPKCVMINNWINEKEVYPLEKNNTGVLTFRKRYGLENKFVIMYSGNIGLYYDLENLIKIIEKYKPGIKTKDGREIVFAFVGAGALLNKLMNYKEKHHMDNVVFIPYQDKKELVYSLNAGDVHWVTNAKGIKGCSVPSKAYGVWSVAKPLIGVLEQGSEIRLILEETKSGKVSDPGAYEEIASNIDWFIKHADDKELSEMGNRGYDNLKKRLTKDASIQKYIETINMI